MPVYFIACVQVHASVCIYMCHTTHLPPRLQHVAQAPPLPPAACCIIIITPLLLPSPPARIIVNILSLVMPHRATSSVSGDVIISTVMRNSGVKFSHSCMRAYTLRQGAEQAEHAESVSLAKAEASAMKV